jgi:hypothetical protein
MHDLERYLPNPEDEDKQNKRFLLLLDFGHFSMTDSVDDVSGHS